MATKFGKIEMGKLLKSKSNHQINMALNNQDKIQKDW
jgi:hypothetical protein